MLRDINTGVDQLRDINNGQMDLLRDINTGVNGQMDLLRDIKTGMDLLRDIKTGMDQLNATLDPRANQEHHIMSIYKLRTPRLEYSG